MFCKMLRRVCKSERGFTLAELMVVVVIIGILTAVAVPVYRNVTDKANRSAVEANLRTIDGALMMYYVENGGATPDQSSLAGDYLQAWPEGPDGVTYAIAGGKATATKKTGEGGTGSWWTTSDTASLPITW